MAEVLAGASAVLSIAGGIQQSNAMKRNAAFEKEQYRQQIENSKVAATQDEVQRRTELQRVLATQQALRSGSGNALFTGSGRRLASVTTENAERDIATARLNFLQQQSQFGLAASEAGGRNTSGPILQGFGQAFGALSNVKWGGFKLSGGSKPSVNSGGPGFRPGQ